jgi:hypothetical protein
MIIISSTNRSNARAEHIADYYITPVDKIIEFLKEFEKVEPIFKSNPYILDPCAGGDSNHLMSYPKAIEDLYGDTNYSIFTIDIRDNSLASFKSDYLKTDIPTKPKVIITNPPFNIAMDIINKALDDVADGGFVIMLLRLNFLETKARKEFFNNHMPKYIFVHHKRMSFTDKGGTDSIAYCHMVWQKGCNPEFSKLKVI